jgi:hypothetical protein
VLETRLQEAFSNTGGITTSGEFPEQAHAAEKEVGSLRGLDRRIAHTHFTINSLQDLKITSPLHDYSSV